MSNHPWPSPPGSRQKRDDLPSSSGSSQPQPPHQPQPHQQRMYGEPSSVNHGGPLPSAPAYYGNQHPQHLLPPQQQQQPHLSMPHQGAPHSPHFGQHSLPSNRIDYGSGQQSMYMHQPQQQHGHFQHQPGPQHAAYNHPHGSVGPSEPMRYHQGGYMHPSSDPHSLNPMQPSNVAPYGRVGADPRSGGYPSYPFQPSHMHEGSSASAPNGSADGAHAAPSIHHQHHTDTQHPPTHFPSHMNSERLFTSQPPYRFNEPHGGVAQSNNNGMLPMGRPVLPSIGRPGPDHGSLHNNMPGDSAPRASHLSGTLGLQDDVDEIDSSQDVHTAGSSAQSGPSRLASGRGRGRGRSKRERTLSRTAMAVSDDPNVRPYACGVPECKIRWKELVAPGEPDTIELANALLAAGWERPPVDQVPLPMFPSAGALSEHMRSTHPGLLERQKAQKTEALAKASEGDSKTPASDTLPKLFCCSVPKCGKGWSSVNGLQYHIQVSGRGKHGHWRTAVPTAASRSGSSSSTGPGANASASASSWTAGQNSPLSKHVANIKDAVESQREHVAKLEAEQPWICPFTEEATGLPMPSSPTLVQAVTVSSAASSKQPAANQPSSNSSYNPINGASGWLGQAQSYAARAAEFAGFGGGDGGGMSAQYKQDSAQQASNGPMGSQSYAQTSSAPDTSAITAGFSAEELAGVPCRKRFRQRGGLAYHICHSHGRLAAAALQYIVEHPDVAHSSARPADAPVPPVLLSPLIDQLLRDQTLKRRIENELQKQNATSKENP